jgi:AsmA protein
MKKAALIIVALVAVIIVGAIAALALIDWNRFKPEIAEAVREATGRELRIDGDIELSILPDIEFRVTGVHLANAAGMTAPDMISVGSLTGKVKLLPLLGRQLIIESFIVSEPAVHLEVDRDGRANWAFPSPGAAAGEPAKAPGERERGLPVSDLALGDVRIENGLVTYKDAVTGQAIEAGDLNLTATLASLESPLIVTGWTVVNNEQVTLDLSADSPSGLIAGPRASVEAAVASKPVRRRWPRSR